MQHPDHQHQTAALPGEAVKVLILAAMGLELEPLRLRLKRPCTERGAFRTDLGELAGVSVALVETGIGRANAERATAAATLAYRPHTILSIGLAGGLTSDLTVGDVVIADRITYLPDLENKNHDGPRCEDAANGENPNFTPITVAPGLSGHFAVNTSVGGLVTVDRPAMTTDQKRKLANASQSLAVDMETYAIARWCVGQRQRFIAVRSISDTFEQSLPPIVEHLVGAGTIQQTGRVLGTAIRTPSVIKQLWGLRTNSLKAADTLAAVVVDIVARLASP